MMDFGPFELSENALKFYNAQNSSEVIYRVIFPTELRLKSRHRVASNTVTAQNVQSTINGRRKRGRPRKGEVKRNGDDKCVEIDGNEQRNGGDAVPLSRTRYGRVTRRPRHMSKFIDMEGNVEEDAGDSFNGMVVDKTVEMATKCVIEEIPEINSLETNIADTSHTEAPQNNEKTKVRRKNLAQFTCKVCKKIYLGRKRIQRHWNVFPDHRTDDVQIASIPATDSFLFNEMMRRINATDESQRNEVLFSELNNFTKQMNLLKETLFVSDVESNSKSTECRRRYLSENVARLFDLPEGNYAVNERRFDTIKGTKIAETVTSQCLFNSANEPVGIHSNWPSSLNGIDPIGEVNYDQISDNAMEASSLEKILKNDTDVVTSPILDISLDLFSFSSA